MKRMLLLAAALLVGGQAALAGPAVEAADKGAATVPATAEEAEAARGMLEARRANAARQRAGDPGAVWMAFGTPRRAGEPAR